VTFAHTHTQKIAGKMIELAMTFWEYL